VTVVVTGAAGEVGRRVVASLVSGDEARDVRPVDTASLRSVGGVALRQLDVDRDDLTETFAGADTLVHLVSVVVPGSHTEADERQELAALERVLDAAETAGVQHVVVLSTAMVYGAWVGNPVPLTEAAPVRPNPDFRWATTRAEVERVARRWADASGVAVSVLRPTAVVASDRLGQLARVVHRARIGLAAAGDPPVQYLHVDDLVSAIVTVVEKQFDGVANVAPDGWIPPDDLAGLEGRQPRISVPAWAARAAAAARNAAGVSPIPPGIVAYTAHSWVVSNDQLRALGWRAEYSNEEAWVVSHEPSPMERLPARQRQELALAVAGVVGLGVLIAVISFIIRLKRGSQG